MRIERQALFWLAALVVAVLGIYWLKAVLLPFVVGMIIAYALNPVTERLARLGLSRVAASALVVALIVLVAGLAVMFLVPPLLAQLQLLIESLPAMLTSLRSALEELARQQLGERFSTFRDGLDKAIAGLELDWSSIVPGLARAAWSQGLAVVNFASLLLITPLVVFYLLVDWHPMLRRVESWLPRDQAPTVTRLAGEIDAAIGAFIRGQGLVCMILATLYALGLTWAGLRYGLLIGVATGIMSFVPFVGWALGLIVSVVAILLQAWPDLVPLYKVLAVFAVIVALDAAVLSPQIVGSRVGLHPLWLIFALFVFSYALGFIGLLVAVPLAAATAVLVRHGLETYLGSDVYHGKAGSRASTGDDG
jgi:predicted PurR-regulated permease PerM